MRLEGWNHIPLGYGADFDWDAAPIWLVVLQRVPVMDRLAYPLMVRRGLAYLAEMPEPPGAQREVPGPGWRIRPAVYRPPGSWNPLQ